jgi:PAS domain S-box-containing protein
MSRNLSSARRWLGPLLTTVSLIAILLIRPAVPIATPGVILLLTVAIAAVWGGVIPALASAFVTALFVAVDASLPGQLFRYQPDQISRLLLNVTVAIAMAVVVGGIQRRLEIAREEAAAARYEDRQRALTEPASDAILTIDATSTIRSANPASEAMFGYPTAQLVGRSLTELMPESLRPRHRAGLRRYLENGVRTIPWQGVELIGRHATGREFPVEVSFGAYGTGYDRRFTGIIRDITRRKELEDQLLQAQKMEAIGQLAGGVAHDFNNLLTAITGYSELLAMDLDETDGRRHQVDGIRQAATRAATLTRQLLAFSRRQQLQSSVINLSGVVTRLDPLLRRLLGENIELVTRSTPGLWPVLADPSQMETVLVNLAVNARDAMPIGGTLTIETANVELDDEYRRRHVTVIPGAYTMLAVSDTGLGMDVETLDHVFEPFFTTKPVGEGTGLGLATVYGIVNQSGGHIWAYSELGRGTTFKVYLPRGEGATLELEESTVSRPLDRGTETILVAEDEPTVRSLLVAVLERQGYRVIVAANGHAAIKVLSDRGSEIDLLVTDVVMPGASGPQVVEAAHVDLPGLPVLYVSGYTANMLAPHELGDGNNLLEKPFTPDRLARAVRDVLDRAPAPGPSDAKPLV